MRLLRDRTANVMNDIVFLSIPSVSVSYIQCYLLQLTKPLLPRSSFDVLRNSFMWFASSFDCYRDSSSFVVGQRLAKIVIFVKLPSTANGTPLYYQLITCLHYPKPVSGICQFCLSEKSFLGIGIIVVVTHTKVNNTKVNSTREIRYRGALGHTLNIR